MGLEYSGELSDTNGSVYLSGPQNVSTTETEAMVGGSAEPSRQFVRIHNKGSQTVYFGPTGVTSLTGEPLKKNQSVEIAARDSIGVFLVTDSGTATVIVQEIG